MSKEIQDLQDEIQALAQRMGSMEREVQVIHSLLEGFSVDMISLDEEIGNAIDRALPSGVAQ